MLELIREFKDVKAPQKNIDCRLIGFKEKYGIDNTHHVHSEKASPASYNVNGQVKEKYLTSVIN